MKKIVLAACCMLASFSFLSPVKAFFLGSDKFTDEEYERAGIVAKHHTILLDEYIFKKGGISISQSMAESLTSLHQTAFETNDENEDKLDRVYVAVVRFIIDLFKGKDKEISRLHSKVWDLSTENMRLKSKIRELKDKQKPTPQTGSRYTSQAGYQPTSQAGPRRDFAR